jgi:hypothetical protein
MKEEYKSIIKQEFLEKAENYKILTEYQHKYFEQFLNVKLAFLTFLGVIVTIVLNARKSFSNIFLLTLILILIILFILLALELSFTFIDIVKTAKKQHKITMLAKIRHVASIRSGFDEYGIESEKMLIKLDPTEQKMRNGESVEKIIQFPSNKLSIPIFIMWILVFISTPVLFLLEVLGKI